MFTLHSQLSKQIRLQNY